MKRLVRWLFNLAAVVSGVLCLATTVLWVRSLSWTDQFLWNRDIPAARISRMYRFISMHGRLWISLETSSSIRYRSPYPTTFFSEKEATDLEKVLPYWKNGNGGRQMINVLGLSYSMIEQTYTHPDPTRRSATKSPLDVHLSQRLCSIPYWLPTLCLLPLPTYWTILQRRRRLADLRGTCPTCGYDLRATPERCPECGSVPKGAEARQT